MIIVKEKNIGKYVHILSRQIKREIDEAVSKYNVTSVQCAVIGFIFDKGKNTDVFAKDIENTFNMRRATVAEILSLMERNKLIERIPSKEDARLKKIVLTPKAIEVKRSVSKKIEDVESKIKNGLSKEEIEEFRRIILKMSQNL